MLFKNLECRLIKTKEELNIFNQNYLTSSSFDVGEEYLNSAHVYQIYKNGDAVAGFALNCIDWSPIRYFHFFDENLKNVILSHNEHGIVEKRLLEITCNYKKHGEGIALEIFYYTHLFKKAYSTAKHEDKLFLLGGSIKAKIKWIQNDVMRYTLFHGPLNHPELNAKGDLEMLELYYINLPYMWYNVIKTALKKYVLHRE
jgi:hypothetical protein